LSSDLDGDVGGLEGDPVPGHRQRALPRGRSATRRSRRLSRSAESISCSASCWVSWFTRSVAARIAPASSPCRAWAERGHGLANARRFLGSEELRALHERLLVARSTGVRLVPGVDEAARPDVGLRVLERLVDHPLDLGLAEPVGGA
jgi:hypothetical protein